MSAIDTLFDRFDDATVTGVVDGLEAFAVCRLTMSGFGKGAGPSSVFVLRDAGRMAMVAEAIGFFAPSIDVIMLPAWDCLPYDRVSPNASISARRMATLARLAHLKEASTPTILLTTVNALLQRLPARDWIAAQSLSIAPGNRTDMADLIRWLETNGFQRNATVRETGEYAVRGGILDLYAAGAEHPLRLDFFGDTLESIRPFDPETQRSVGQEKRIDLVPTNEIVLDEEAIGRFRQNYRAQFGAATRDDMLYQAVSEGRRYPGMEHWLPLFHESLDTLDAYFGDAPVMLDALIDDAIRERSDQVADHYASRRDIAEAAIDGGSAPYKPLPPEALYLGAEDIAHLLADRKSARFSPFAVPDGQGNIVDIGGRVGRSFAAERAAGDVNVFDALVEHVAALRKAKRRVVIASWSEGSRDRLQHVLSDHGLDRQERAADWAAVDALPKDVVALVVLGVESGIETDEFVIIGEQDVLGDRLVRSRRKSKRAQDFLTDASSLGEGDLVVHVDHGIGRFVGLKTIEAAGAPHDCLDIRYHGDDKLFLPVENIELLTRYGSEDAEVQLDRLGGGGWQARKARMKARIREIADNLIKTAAARAMKTADVIETPEGLSDEFAARFPYEETDDQLNAIDAILGDLSSGKPADRLVCGDVGFGKTEVALRAAFAVALSGRQVAVVVPTTLLSRQHYATFAERFKGLPVQVAQASRLVGQKEVNRVKAGLKDGTIDIVVGTHALLGKGVDFRNLGLLIIDEEQHFGVKHKERLKELKTDVHVITLTATPIPRTLQLALSGVREMSIIATPPVDRLAVRTFISPFDALVVREALLRERYRGGQSFYVCPRVSDLAETKEFLDQNVPEVKVAVAHGQMAPGVLEDIMTAFYEGRYDVLLSTTIVESGLDIPTANTLIVHRSDMFGLGSALSATRTGRAFQGPGLCSIHCAGGQETDAGSGSGG